MKQKAKRLIEDRLYDLEHSAKDTSYRWFGVCDGMIEMAHKIGLITKEEELSYSLKTYATYKHVRFGNKEQS